MIQTGTLCTIHASIHLIGFTPTRLKNIVFILLSSTNIDTWHISRAVPITSAPDAQLPSPVVAPALDTASSHNDASVVTPQGDGDGDGIDACRDIRQVGFEPRSLGILSPALCQLRLEPGCLPRDQSSQGSIIKQISNRQ